MRFTEKYWDDLQMASRSIPHVELLNGKNILITGATGMICSVVAEMLMKLNVADAGIKIYLAGRSKNRMEHRFEGFVEGADYYFVQFDATEASEIKARADYIIHGAGNANPEAYTMYPVETMLGNFIGLNSLLDFAVKNNSKRLLYISSSEVYGLKETGGPYKEDDYGNLDILIPRACYPSAKRAAETLCIAYGEEYGLETVIVRPGHIYGPSITNSDTRASAQFTQDVVNGHDIHMKSSGEQKRSYCYAVDCATAILSVLLNGKNGEAYNISNRNSIVSVRDMANALAEYTGRKVVFENPSDLERKGYNLMMDSSLKSEKIEALGWKALFDLQSGVQRTIDYLMKDRGEKDVE